ncbi:MAG TPA: 30S ribosomal protein S17 [Dehalococcoidia bacterium]|nr:30S ribosomal protein S17 [Dehalococcoidia bacterium]
MAKQMRKVRVGSVVRTKMDKTAVVEMVWKQRHVIYSKQMRRVARFYVHDPESRCQIGDMVRIEETRPISKTKHWRLLEVLRHQQMAEISPIELEDAITPVMTGETLAGTPPRAGVEDAVGDSRGQVEGAEE